MSDTSLLFRTSRGVAHDFWHTLLVSVIFIGGWLGLYAIVSANFQRIWIDLQSVQVSDHHVNQTPRLEAWREIKRDGVMTYTVTVRRAETHEYMFGSAEPEQINYTTRANATQPLVTSLAKWFGAPGAYQAKASGSPDYGPGNYYINTCHIKRVLLVIPFKRCVQSNVFRRYD